ncbi:MAG: MBL fold metallo-hydrolase [Betaproteobacteria bacterium]|nr:MBL fold metallo-hydrolase [Betaproteobacteria bacterium]
MDNLLPATIRVLERGWLSSNNIVLHDDAGSGSVIDSGYVSHGAQTVALVRHALDGRRLERLVNTHCHSDHIGGNAALARVFGCTITIPAGEARNVAEWDTEALHLDGFGQRCDRFSFHSTLASGDTLTMGGLHWQAIAAPGHDMDALVLYAPEARILISADALWENGFGVLFPELYGEPGLAATRATLDHIATLEVDVVIPGHGPVFGNVSAALERAYARVEAFERDPERVTRNAFRALLVFYLLDRQAAGFDELAGLLAQASFFAMLNSRSYRLEPGALAQKLVGELAAAGVLRVDAGLVRPAG